MLCCTSSRSVKTQDKVQQNMTRSQFTGPYHPPNGLDPHVTNDAQPDKHKGRKISEVNGHNGSHVTGPSRAAHDATNETPQENVLSPKKFDRAGAFVDNLLSCEVEDISYSLDYDILKPESEIYICKDENAKYTLCRSCDTLGHELGLAEGQLDDDFRQLVYAPQPENDNQKVPFCCYEDLGRYDDSSKEQGSAKVVRAEFVPLGWLQKSVPKLGDHLAYGNKHTTNYVLLWNTSTNPHSLWLCYDYYTPDIHSFYHCLELGKPTYYNEAEEYFFGIEGDGFDFDSNTESNEDCYYVPSVPLEEDPDRDQVVDRADMAPPPERSPVPDTPPSPIAFPPGKGTPRTPGFFKTDSPFDLAVLAVDIKQWDADKGLDPASMRQCLKTLRFRLGKTLRARASSARY